MWEQNPETWNCNSNVYCTSPYDTFPKTVSDVNGSGWWWGQNECFKGDNVQVGNLEEMEKNTNGIRWFETESPEMCPYASTVTHLSNWLQEFKPNGKF